MPPFGLIVWKWKILRSKLAFGCERGLKIMHENHWKNLNPSSKAKSGTIFKLLQCPASEAKEMGPWPPSRSKMVFLVLCDFFGQIHSTSLNFSLQIGLWTKKRLVFVFVSILMTMSYMSLEIFSFEWIQILNGRKVWQYHRLSHHKIWATSIHIWFFEFHTNIYMFFD